MRTLSLLLLFALGPMFAHAGSMTLDWTPPTQNTDGTALTNLASYQILFGTDPNALSKSATVKAGVSSFTIDNLAAGKWYGVVIAVTSAGAESDSSNLASKAVTDSAPDPTPLVTAGPFSYEPTGTVAAPTMSAIGLIDAGLSCGPAARVVGNVKFCQITRAQTDLIGWPQDKTLKNGLWARAQ